LSIKVVFFLCFVFRVIVFLFILLGVLFFYFFWKEIKQIILAFCVVMGIDSSIIWLMV
jgi:hypothetical protein